MTLGRSPFGRIMGRAIRLAHRNNLIEAGQLPEAGSGEDRRRFLQHAAMAAGAAFLPSCTSTGGGSKASGAVTSSDRIAIVGGGIAGLTAAYSLQRRGVKCEVFDANNRFGGRMHTGGSFNADGQVIDLGGTWVDTGHTALRSLAAELGVATYSVQTPGFADVYHFGGKVHGQAEVINALQPFAAVLAADAERLYTADEEWTPFAFELDKTNLQFYLDKMRDKVEGWALDMIGVAYNGEFGDEPSTQSCLNLVDFIDTDLSDGFDIFGESDEALRIRGGVSSVPNALVARLQKGDTPLNLGHQLVRIRDVNGRLELTFKVANGPTKAITVAKVINTLTFPMLRKVEGIDTLGLPAAKMRVINEFNLGANSKTFASFTDRHWRGNFGHANPSNGTVYTDAKLQSTTDHSKGQAGKRGILEAYMGGNAARSGVSASALISTMETVFPGLSAKYENVTQSIKWHAMPHFKGSYSTPAPGQYTTFIDTAARAELGGRLLFAGEQTSTESNGYMNGGVESGLRAASEV